MSTPTATADVVSIVSRAAKAAEDAAAAMSLLLEVLTARDERIARFRDNSAARLVAELLLTYPDQWLGKDALAQAAQVSPTSVPRVVATLAASGVPVERKTDSNRRAFYRVRGGRAA